MHVQQLILEDFRTAWRQPEYRYTRPILGNNTSRPKPTAKQTHSHVQSDNQSVDSHAQTYTASTAKQTLGTLH